ncbi:hypothetical protein T05_6409 [Trichinella murrelli]|uniref:Uncharacterized protein n=1 Tax=Trichinella murrelli TaxID=144512 RepID=A0A0V0TZU8_9BILA|nr:hypothetical protein T05_6409 [Trichinella murrelli]
MAYNLPQYIVHLHCSEVSEKDFPDNDGRQPTCAYRNAQGSSPSETPLILIDDKKFFDIIMRYSLKMPRASKRLPFAYLNTQGSRTSETPLIPIDDKKFFDIIMRYSLKMPRASKRLPFAYLNTQGSRTSETPLIPIDDIFRHYNEVFAVNDETCAIFRCFGQVDFP